jgi:hypothetical protein
VSDESPTSSELGSRHTPRPADCSARCSAADGSPPSSSEAHALKPADLVADAASRAFRSTGLKIPVSGVQFSPCPPLLSPAKRGNPVLGVAFRHFGSRDHLGMGRHPLGWFLTSDWGLVWGPVFGGDKAGVRGCRCRTAARHGVLGARDALLEGPPRTTLPALLPDPWANRGLVLSEDQGGLGMRGLENGKAVRRRQVRGAGVSSSTTRSR